MDSPARTTLDLRLREDTVGVAEKTAIVHWPFDIEHVFTPRGAAYDFRWDGSRAYLAWHDIVLNDGEMQGDAFSTVRGRDLRRRMTFFPEGHQASGWCAQAPRANSYAALYFDQSWLFNQVEAPMQKRSLHPMVYFHDRALLDSMEKIARVARARTVAPRLVLDSLVLVAGAELLRSLGDQRTATGALTQAHQANAKAYIDAHLTEDIALAEIAAAVGLSTHYFIRAFKQSEGVTPYRYVLQQRIERAKSLIDKGAGPIASIGQQLGFKSASHFSRTFVEFTGLSPRDYRKSRRA